MKILIIGSKGFIGQHLKRFLMSKDHEVWGADVVVDYVHPEKYFLIDASNADFHELFKEVNFDVCINCSGAASVPDSLQHPLRDYNLNTANVFKLLDAIRLSQPGCKFINLSSAAVYGNPPALPVAA
jgi:dTDP-glucose 4,6-dehydratase/UDP-glucose 4-epimerase